MKKKFLFSGLALISVAGTNAQTTVTQSNFAPAVGNVITYLDCSNPNIGSGGANQTWDFSAVSTLGGSTTFNYVACGGVTPPCSDYSGANIVATAGPGNNGYFVSNGTDYAFAGANAGGGLYNAVYSNPRSDFKFPITYQANATDTYNGYFDVGTFTTYESGSQTFFTDGYGTLKTPAGTFTGVFRFHQSLIGQDSTNTGGVPDVSTSTVDNYSWVKAGIHGPLFQVSISNGGTPESFYQSNPTGIEQAQLETSFSMHPVPAHTEVTVSYDANKAQNAEILLTDLTGRTLQLVTGNNTGKVTISTANLASGIYLVRLKTAEAEIVRKLEVL